MKPPLLIIAAGGTGGHMFPAQALAERMLLRGWRVKLSTDDRGARYAGGFPNEVQIEVIKSATFARGGALSRIVVPLKIARGALSATFAMRSDRPDVVAGFGGYPTIPAMLAGGFLGIPRLIHEQNGVLGRVNKIFAKRVAKVACGTWPTKLPRGVEGIFTGNPVRERVIEHLDVAYVPPNLGPARVLVLGGSQGARILSDVVPDALAKLPENIRYRLMVVQQARPEDQERVAKVYEDIGIEATVSEFIADVPDQMAKAQLVISRAGASTVAEISAIGRPAILVPYAAATGDHQTANAMALATGGGAIVIQEKEFEVEKLSLEAMRILSQADNASEMAQAARNAGKPKAAAELADIVENLGLKQP